MTVGPEAMAGWMTIKRGEATCHDAACSMHNVESGPVEHWLGSCSRFSKHLRLGSVIFEVGPENSSPDACDRVFGLSIHNARNAQKIDTAWQSACACSHAADTVNLPHGSKHTVIATAMTRLPTLHRGKSTASPASARASSCNRYCSL